MFPEASFLFAPWGGIMAEGEGFPGVTLRLFLYYSAWPSKGFSGQEAPRITTQMVLHSTFHVRRARAEAVAELADARIATSCRTHTPILKKYQDFKWVPWPEAGPPVDFLLVYHPDSSHISQTNDTVMGEILLDISSNSRCCGNCTSLMSEWENPLTLKH